jgi:Rad3-related DNA helicase
MLRRLLRFCADGRLLVYDGAQFDVFLKAEGIKVPERVDALRLARIACPQATDYSIEAVAEMLGLPPEADRHAVAQARLLRSVWLALTNKVADLPPAALDAICRIAEVARDPLAPLLADAAARRGNLELSADPDKEVRELFADHRRLFQRVQKHAQPEPADAPISPEGICRMFTRAGAIGKHLPQYEQRAEQVAMVRAVCEAFNEPSHLLAEAGTGTGKSLAYLVPAIAWACTNEDKVIVSTNTRNLQEQLYRKDLPFLMQLLPNRFEPALLKGRRNYLCVRRFAHIMRHFERELAEPEDLMALLPLISWAAQTQSGDLAECNAFLLSPAAPSVIQAVVSGPDECAGRACRFRERCFVNRARALAQLADLIVVNHALLFAELGLDNRVLPPYRCVIFDEAHNLEDVATEAFATVVDGPAVYRATNRLYRARRDGSGSGLLATVMYEAGAGRTTASSAPFGRPGKPRAARPKRANPARVRLTDVGGAAMKAVEEVVAAAKQFFETIAQPFMELPPDVERVLLQECSPELGRGSEAWSAAQRVRDAVQSLGEKVEELAQTLEKAEEASSVELADDLRAQVARLREVCEAMEFVLAQEDENYVYWLERTTRERGTFYSVQAAPLRIGQFIRDFFFNDKRCVIMTSATLEVDGKFDYMIERLGADTLEPGRVRCMSVGSPFDYDRQSLVGVPTFLPDPGGRRDRAFDNELSSFLVDLLRCTRGRALVLFTSYSLLDAVYETIKEPLQRAGIMVLAQGHSGSVEAITSLFRTVTSSVLLGTRSFWEGVDISGEALSCLVLTKLPFHVFTDPLVRGRTEYLRSEGKDPFEHYTLPQAVISFRQGFGRLIRNRTDTGVIIVTDRRMVTKGYGRSFLSSLPTRHLVFRSPEEALKAVGDFFSADRPGVA